MSNLAKFTRHAASVYSNWAMYAVLGRLAEADHLVREYGNVIATVARALREAFPFEPKPLHRGTLMERAGMFDPTGGGRRFVSWSDDPDVALWFADPLATINDYITGTFPNARGFLMTLEPKADLDVLFHYSWAERVGVLALARQHPDVNAEHYRQIEWSLSTQKEVITPPLVEWPERRPFAPHDRQHQLNRRFTPPWLPEETEMPKTENEDLNSALARVTAAIESVPDRVAEGRCQDPPFGCGRSDVKPEEFRDDEARIEYEMSALCQACQDRVFGEEGGDGEAQG